MTRHPARLIPIVMVLLAASPVCSVWAGPPTDQLRQGVDRVVAILHDPALAGDRQIDQRRAAIAKVAGEIFDFSDMARRSLGTHWESRTPADQNAATAHVAFLGDTISEDHAVVRTTIPLSNGGTMPLDYRMHDAGGRWQVYDLSMDGVSLLANYRAQFNKIIRTESFEELVAKLKANQAQFAAPAASPASGRAGK
jgi:phospholipid transport system substrate-binding protein